MALGILVLRVFNGSSLFTLRRFEKGLGGLEGALEWRGKAETISTVTAITVTITMTTNTAISCATNGT